MGDGIRKPYKLHLHLGKEGFSVREARKQRLRRRTPYSSESQNINGNGSAQETVDPQIRNGSVQETVDPQIISGAEISPMHDESDSQQQSTLEHGIRMDVESVEQAYEIVEELSTLENFLDELEYRLECQESVKSKKIETLDDLMNDPTFFKCLKSCSTRSPAEILLMILTFSLHANLSFSGISNLINMINVILGEEILPDTRFMLDKIMNGADNCEFHGVCPECSIYIGQLDDAKKILTCSKCQTHVDLSNPSCLNFFIIINPSQYIADCLQFNELYYDDAVNGKLRSDDNIIRDVYDGVCYQKFLELLPEESKKNYVTAMFNSDGAPCFESSDFSIWPIYLQLNEIPPQERLKSTITTALWFGKKKPELIGYLHPFVNIMNNLGSAGFETLIKGQTRTIKLYCLEGCADAVARAPMLGMKQFNGHYGCTWCLHEGKSSGGSMRYPIKNVVPPVLRDMQTSILHMEEALQKNECIFGFNYASPLINLRHFDIISGFIPDYMHFYVGGVAKQLTEYYMENLSEDEIKTLDEIISQIKAPHQICRLTRPLSDRGHWKAREWENWVLYYSIPILTLILTKKALDHWILLVDSLHILLGTEISHEAVQEAQEMLVKFVADTETIYTDVALTSNVHTLLHVCQSVLDWGPLWAHSNFSFESANAILLKAIHCAKGVNLQIMRHINLQHNMLKLKNKLYPNCNAVIKRYCENVQFPRVQKTFKFSSFRYFGSEKVLNDELMNEHNLSALKTFQFGRIVKGKTIYSTYDKCNERSCNSYAQLHDGRFVRCLSFAVDCESKKEVVFFHELKIGTLESSKNLMEVTSVVNTVNCAPTLQIKRVCIFMHVADCMYICPIVNSLYY